MLNKSLFRLSLSVIPLTSGLTSFAQTKSIKPNIIFFLADDLGWTDLACYGSKFYETPNLYALSKEGMLFTNAYAACPVSSPTRASFQTGKYPGRIGITDWIPGMYNTAKGKSQILSNCAVLPPVNLVNLPLEELTIAEVLKSNGYKTAHIGKWHLSEDSLLYPQFQGYDINIAGCSKGHPTGYFVPYRNSYLPDGPKGEYLTDRLGDECVKVIQQFKNQPFFISFPFYQVHTPLAGKPDKIKYFKEKALKLGLDTLKNVFEENPLWKSKQPFNINNLKERLVQNNPIYAAMIASMDENIGKVIDELKRQGIYDNTIIIFTSDNGGLSTAEGSPTSNFPLKTGKGHLYEGGIREPLIVRWKGKIQADSKCEMPVSTIDYYPTILEMLSLPIPPKQCIDGVSILSALKGNKQNRDAIFWHYPHYSNQGGRPGGAIRKGDFKLIEFYDDNSVELYDLKNDIGENINLSNKNTKITASMLSELKTWRKTVGAKMPTFNLNFNGANKKKQ